MEYPGDAPPFFEHDDFIPIANFHAKTLGFQGANFPVRLFLVAKALFVNGHTF